MTGSAPSGIRVHIEGWDGSKWDLNDGDIAVTEQTLEVLYAFATESFTRTAYLLDGQEFVEWKALPREFPLQVSTRKRQELGGWYATDQAWKKMMRPGETNRLLCTAPDGGVRALSFRMTGEDPILTVDPSQRRLTYLDYELVADDPWWYSVNPRTSDPLRGGFRDAPFFGPEDAGPPFYIADDTDFVMVANHGEVPAWPVWTFVGPMTGFQVGVRGRRIAATRTLGVGQKLVVDTRPRRKFAVLADGTVITRSLTARQYTQIDPGASVPVEVVLLGSQQGAGYATVTIHEQFFRGF
jgi:hypothetical protein